MLAGRLERLLARAAAAPGRLAVLDTNVFLHYEPPAQVDWTRVVGAAKPRLVVPLRVIEELDEKKYTAREQVADRARAILSSLWQLLEPTGGAPAPLRENTTIEVPVEDESRDRPVDADAEVLRVCSDLGAAAADVVLVTGPGLSLRAQARLIPVMRMPDKYLRRKPTGDQR